MAHWDATMIFLAFIYCKQIKKCSLCRES